MYIYVLRCRSLIFHKKDIIIGTHQVLVVSGQNGLLKFRYVDATRLRLAEWRRFLLRLGLMLLILLKVCAAEFVYA